MLDENGMLFSPHLYRDLSSLRFFPQSESFGTSWLHSRNHLKTYRPNLYQFKCPLRIFCSGDLIPIHFSNFWWKFPSFSKYKYITAGILRVLVQFQIKMLKSKQKLIPQPFYNYDFLLIFSILCVASWKSLEMCYFYTFPIYPEKHSNFKILAIF